MTFTQEGGKLTVGRVVDWDVAAGIGAWLARPGPPATDYTQRQIVDELAEFSRRAEIPVRELTGLAPGGQVPDAMIVDRPHWVRLAADSMRVMTGGGEGPRGFLRGRITGAQTGAVLAFVASGILGQYDPFATGDGAAGGKLLLIYPNIIAVERQLRLVPKDFRMWVCLHEVTHRVQFTANPWLTDYMSSALGVITQEAGDDFSKVLSRLADYVRNRRDGAPVEPNSAGIIGLLRILQSEPQRKALDRLLVLGTLLEGHADHVMDAVGPAVVPTVSTIRERFDERRQRRQPPLQRLIRALLGFDAKISQYTRGKAFVERVVSQVGMERFNTVWSGPDTLPLPDEIDEPTRWIDRVL
ncbi:MAG: zinc-dependent metalloprotease [Mycobacteriaceae bacterium]|nr:zinc-dependent metalloprotease [Mycobacteriaceae bacterium]